MSLKVNLENPDWTFLSLPPPPPFRKIWVCNLLYIAESGGNESSDEDAAPIEEDEGLPDIDMSYLLEMDSGKEGTKTKESPVFWIFNSSMGTYIPVLQKWIVSICL